MLPLSNTPSRKGFSLIELLVVIALIGLLAGLLIPSVGSIRQQAQITTAGHNLRQVLIAWSAEVRLDSSRLDRAESIHHWALELARRQGLNDARLFRLKGDQLSAGMADGPVRIGTPDARGGWTLEPAFAESTLSIVVATGVSPSAHPPSTPVAWTRGLGGDGRWRGSDSDRPGVFGDRGGFIAFLDGRVEFFTDLSANGGLLSHYGSGAPTSDIREALPPEARVLPGDTFQQGK